jgi:hypothetical protein
MTAFASNEQLPIRAISCHYYSRFSCYNYSITDGDATVKPSTPGINDLCYYVDRRGRQHFNFVQQVWLRAEVEMAVTPVMTVALETLAINLLTQVTRRRDYAAAVGTTSRCVVKLAHRFCAECLLTARADGWVMPRPAVRAWLNTQSRRQKRPMRALPTVSQAP